MAAWSESPGDGIVSHRASWSRSRQVSVLVRTEALDRYFREQVTVDVRRRATACYVR